MVNNMGASGYELFDPQFGLLIKNGVNNVIALLCADPEYGFSLEPDFETWEISVSGNCSIDEEDGYKWLTITGDCTINAKLIA